MSVACRETEIRDQFGETIWDAIGAFTQDPSYLAEMIESANLIEYKRQLWGIRAEAIRRANTPEEVKAITQQILLERGIQPPVTKTQRGGSRAQTPDDL